MPFGRTLKWRVNWMLQHVYLIPGMFGFSHLASYDYFGHVERALSTRFDVAGEEVFLHVVDVAPTASVRRRAATLAAMVQQTSAGNDAPIHLLGHSTGGLDARLVASPGSQLANAASAASWLPRLCSITTMNTPHFGTPLASFFATANGERVLYALSALTVIGLSLGKRPLAVASMLVGMARRDNRVTGIRLHVMDKAVESLIGLVDDARSPEVRSFLRAIEEDQGAVLQLSPEAMDVMVAGFEDRPGVVYQSSASLAPTPAPGKWLRTFGSPWRATSMALFATLHRITSRLDDRYPCACVSQGVVAADDKTEATLLRLLGVAPERGGNDGIVPLRSQLWGTLVWAGLGDHLDVLGHYRGDQIHGDTTGSVHRDWLTSGASFGAPQFEALMDAIAKGMLDAAAARPVDARIARSPRRSA